MRRSNDDWLGPGFDPIKFWAFNAFAVIAWGALSLLETFAIIGIGYILETGTVEVVNSPLGQLGGTFLNLMYGVSVMILATFIIGTWFLVNMYLVRKELYQCMNRVFRWGDL